MEPRHRILFLPALFFFLACGPRLVIPAAPVIVEPVDELFLKAEKMFQLKSYKNALSMYHKYLAGSPDKRRAPAALIKTGEIYTTLGNYKKARNAYDQLIAKHPDSPLVEDAKVEILATYYREGKYQEVIRRAPGILKNTASKIHIFKTYALLGDTYLALDSPAEVVYLYSSAYNKFRGMEKESIIEKLKKAVRQLDSKDIISILNRLEDEQFKGNFLYLLGVGKAKEEKYDEAVKTLSGFVEMYPEHEMVQQAKSLIEELSKKSVYSRYTIGCVLPLSGPYKIYGNRVLKGIELALDQFSSPGINPSIKIIIKDTGSDPYRAARSVQELFAEHVAAIIGPIVTPEPAASEAQDRGIPIITLTQKDHITDIGDYVFRNFITPAMQANALVSYAVEELGLNSFAILYPDENYGITYMNLFWDKVIDHGGQVVGVESYDLAQTDFADTIKKLVGLYYVAPEELKDTSTPTEEALFEPIVDFDVVFDDPIEKLGKLYYEMPADLRDLPETFEDEEEYFFKSKEEEESEEKPGPIIDFDAIFIPDAPHKVGLITPQLAFYDIKGIYLLGTNLWHSDSLIAMSRQYIQGAILSDGFYAESSSKEVSSFVKIFKETFKEKPGYIEAVAYDTAMILFQIISRPDIRFRSAIKDELMNLADYQGLTGVTSFDYQGEAHKKLYLLRIKGDKFVELRLQ